MSRPLEAAPSGFLLPLQALLKVALEPASLHRSPSQEERSHEIDAHDDRWENRPARDRRAEQGPAGHPGVLGHQDPCDDTGRDGRRCPVDDARGRLRGEHPDLPGGLHRHAGPPAAKRYHPFLYWAVVVATTTVGTTMSDYLDRTLELGYVKSSIVLFCGVLVVLFVWHRSMGRIEFEHITTRPNEIFYWVTILVSNTLGTALGDFVATTTGLGFERGSLEFAGLLALVALAHFLTKIPKSVIFWSAYVLTRPLGATLGDTLTKSHVEGGLGLGRIISSLVIAAGIVVGIVLTSRWERRG